MDARLAADAAARNGQVEGHPLSRERHQSPQRLFFGSIESRFRGRGSFPRRERGCQQNVVQRLDHHRVVSISGLPGCGKSAVLKRFAQKASTTGPILFLKNDRIVGTGWSTFATGLGLSNIEAVPLLLEIGATGTPILFIDGIDRIRPDQQGVIVDLINAIQSDPNLSNWRVLVSSRDQGLEAFRAWFPPTMYANSGIGDVIVQPFSDEEAEQLAQSKPRLRKLLFGNPPVRSVARRPFFAAVLARSIPEGTEPQTEVDLIAAWWARAGHDAAADTVPQRQRALIDIAEKGVRNLGKSIPARDLKDSTIDANCAPKGGPNHPRRPRRRVLGFHARHLL